MSEERYQQIGSRELPELMRQGVVLVDVRRPDEWQLTGVVTGSILLTFFDQAGQSHPALWLQQLNQQVDVGNPLALICRSGYRTAIVCDYLLQKGRQARIYNVHDGILGWLQAGLPVAQISR